MSGDRDRSPAPPTPAHRLGDHPLSAQQAADMIDRINPEPERAYSEADAILLAVAPPAVADAYRRLTARCAWWATA